LKFGKENYSNYRLWNSGIEQFKIEYIMRSLISKII
jgi:hypothetical protein